jgi:ATP-binding cassette, subfamily A (ABC1), member 3
VARLFRKRKPDVHAVTNLHLDAHKGQILTLLGPNGSGKSTTLNCIAGLSKITGGSIDIYSNGGLGIAPQANVMWKELTVEEHIRIFAVLKATTGTDTNLEIEKLISSCDLDQKRHAMSKTLSGGQKRKLQLALMFAGGSAVCCVDEVSSGLDPLSRRKVWDILLAERTKRTIIMTTHFLDEADALADYIVIMAKGKLGAEGSASQLKQRLGDGYTVAVARQPNLLPPEPTEHVAREDYQQRCEYRIPDAMHVHGFLDTLERAGFSDYNISGPSIEELFLKITTDSSPVEGNSSMKDSASETELRPLANTGAVTLGLQKGRHLSGFSLCWILFRKRLTVFRRRWVPYFVAIAIALIGAGVAPLLMKDLKSRPECPSVQQLSPGETYDAFAINLGTVFKQQIVIGPGSSVNDQTWHTLADLYSSNRSAYPDSSYYGFRSASEVKELFHVVNSKEEFDNVVVNTPGDIWPGGIYFSNPPVVAYSESFHTGIIMQNLLPIIGQNVNISTSYSIFGQVDIPITFDFMSLIFLFYYGLICVAYPAFFALYPTQERLSNLRAMSYSNGVRPAPLWLSHLAFDTCWVLVISVVSVILLAISTKVWYFLPLLWLVFFLYGITSALLSYVLSLIAPSALAAWAFSALGQFVMYIAVFGGTIGVVSTLSFDEMASTMDKVYFTVGIISPSASLFRGMSTSLGQFTQNCRIGDNPAALTLYGGPILYLVLQAVVLLLILLWHDSSNNALLLSRFRKYSRNSMTAGRDAESANTSGLSVTSLTKRFQRTTVLDNVTFSVSQGTTFALLGPNGAGKSTAISLIRGELQPSTAESAISVAGISPLTHRALARAHIGVCPQFDATDTLTVKEMLTFYARVRGVKHVLKDVNTAMRACGIEGYADRLTAALSGGTKRKLSLAVALLGNPAVLLLDEPSSGLDAGAKRVLWRTLQAVSGDRAVVLTTHSMEEAEAVADVVSILSCRVLALGPKEDIKRQGGGDEFYVHIEAGEGNKTPAEDMEMLKTYILREFDGARIEREVVAGQIRFSIPQVGHTTADGGRMKTASLFEKLEEAKRRLGLSSYSVGRPTLDQVFVNVVTAQGGEEENSRRVEKPKRWLCL